MARKNKKKKRPEGFDPNERKRERIEARRQAKAEALERRRKAQRREKIVRRIGIVALAVFAVWFFFLRGQPPDEIAGHEVEHYSTSQGNPTHPEGDLSYEMSPPVSGAHNQIPAECGTYGEAIPDENFVHTLEHGAVAILYDPSVPIDQIRAIEELVGEYDSHTVSAPYAGQMETPIALAAWANIMRLEEFEEPAAREFIEEFRGGGVAPEAGEPCPNDQDDDFDPPESPAPNEPPGASPPPTGAPEASPAPGDGKRKKETPAP